MLHILRGKMKKQNRIYGIFEAGFFVVLCLIVLISLTGTQYHIAWYKEAFGMTVWGGVQYFYTDVMSICFGVWACLLAIKAAKGIGRYYWLPKWRFIGRSGSGWFCRWWPVF